MSRVLLLSLDQGDVVSNCLSAKVGISAIEELPAGGTRLVCMSNDGAAAMRRKLKGHLLKGQVARRGHRPEMPLW